MHHRDIVERLARKFRGFQYGSIRTYPKGQRRRYVKAGEAFWISAPVGGGVSLIVVYKVHSSVFIQGSIVVAEVGVGLANPAFESLSIIPLSWVGRRVIALAIPEVLAVCTDASVATTVVRMVNQCVTSIPNTTRHLVSVCYTLLD